MLFIANCHLLERTTLFRLYNFHVAVPTEPIVISTLKMKHYVLMAHVGFDQRFRAFSIISWKENKNGHDSVTTDVRNKVLYCCHRCSTEAALCKCFHHVISRMYFFV